MKKLLLPIMAATVFTGCAELKEVAEQTIKERGLENRVTHFCYDTSLFGLMECPDGTFLHTTLRGHFVPFIDHRLCFGFSRVDDPDNKMICVKRDIVKGE